VRPLQGWALPLRLAQREARRHRARSLLVLVMIALPVLGVTIADTVYTTSALTGTEGLDRRLGTAAARVQLADDAGLVYQDVDPEGRSGWASGRRGDPVGLDDLLAVLGPDRPVAELVEGTVSYETALGVGDAQALELPLGDPLTDGLVDLTSGRWPSSEDEVLVNEDLDDRGPGESLVLRDGTTRTIVGTAEDARYRDMPRVFGLPGSLDLRVRGTHTWLVGGAPVTWDQVRASNELGATVLSRAVLADPPPDSALAPEVQLVTSEVDTALVTVAVLVVVMVLIEVVLLAGPAFAVGARQQTRTLALVAAAGGTPRQARRVVLAAGLVLGAAGSALGVGLGLVLARLVMPLAQSRSGTWFGPFDVAWWHLLAVAAFGLVSALLAAAVPAWLASRQDVVAVLGGRRGDPRPSRRSPVLGLVLLGGGVAAASYGATRREDLAPVLIAAAAILCVLGMVLLVPVVVLALARVARRLPLSLRFAARDAARHRTRTVPAVAAVAATVAGVVALGIAVTSDEAQNRETYRPQQAMGSGAVFDYDARGYDALADAIADVAPGLEQERVLGLSPERRRGYVDARFLAEGAGDGPMLGSWGGSFGSSVLVADRVPALTEDLTAEQRESADRVLARGGMVVFTDAPVRAEEATLVVRLTERRDEVDRRRVTAPTAFLVVADGYAPAQGLLSTEVAERLGLPTAEVGLLLPGPVDRDQEADVSEVVRGISPSAMVYVERGYESPDEVAIIQLVLGVLGGVLMLGGTLTATFLALSDARPDLATLAAVGAAPRTRRGVAASYALVVGLVGSVLGAVVGAVPGVAVSYPLTRSFDPTGEAASHYLAVPWTVVGVVVLGLPLLVAALVGLAARSRLPLAARLE
jgi:putative ABC transport system permease protein